MRLKKKHNGQSDRRSGQALVELSLVLIFLIILTMGLIQYGVIASTNNTLVQLSRDAARYAAQTGSTDVNFNNGSSPNMAIWASSLQSDCADTTIKFTDLSASASCGGAACPIGTMTTKGVPPTTQFTITITYDMIASKRIFLPLNFLDWFGFGVFRTKSTLTSSMLVQ